MKKFYVFSVFIMALAIGGCSGAQKKNVHLDGYWQGKGQSVAYKKFTKVMNWAPGQYVVTGNLDDGERKSVTRTTIVRREQGGWVFESITTDDEGQVTGMQILIRGYEQAVSKKDPSRISAVWAKILQADGSVQKFEGDSMALYNMMLKSAWEKLVVSGVDYAKSGAVTVPAGVFAGTTSMKVSVSVLFKTITQVSYHHPDVPVNGMVKAMDEDGETVSELLSYGFNGKAVIK